MNVSYYIHNYYFFEVIVIVYNASFIKYVEGVAQNHPKKRYNS